MQKKITIVIPTHNRQDYLTRILEYYNDNITLIIADSSELEYTRKLPLRTQYFHYPQMPLVEKLMKATALVTTPYLLVCADDDFIIPETIFKCIDFLEGNNDFSSAQGKYLAFYNLHGYIFFEPYYVNNYKMSVHSDDIKSRLIEQFSPYMHLSYAVFRTKDITLAYHSFYTHAIQDYNLLELSVAIHAAINGKHKILNNLYSVRESIFGSSSSSCNDLYSSMRNEEYTRFINMHIEHILTKITIESPIAEQWILNAIYAYKKFIEHDHHARANISYKSYMKEFDRIAALEVKKIKILVQKHNIKNKCDKTFMKCIYIYASILFPSSIKQILHKIFTKAV